MKKIGRWIVTAAVGLISLFVLLFAVANRQTVNVSFDPFNKAAPALSFEMPLFLVMFAALIAGVLLGGSVVWLAQGKHRKAGRQARAECERARSELELLRTRGSDLPPQQHVPVIAPF